MKQQNFVTTALTQPVQQQALSNTVQTKRTNLFGAIAELYTKYVEWSARRNREKICRQTAKLFRTDMDSAGTLLFLYRGATVWIEGDPYEERARIRGLLPTEQLEDEDDDTDEDEQEEEKVIVHPPLSRNFVEATAPTIPEHELNALSGRLNGRRMAK